MSNLSILKQIDNYEIFQAMFLEATLGIMVVNQRGKILKANPLLEQLFGYDEGELLGKAVEVLVPDSHKKPHVNHRKTYQENPTPRLMGNGRELSGKRKDGSEFSVEISLNYVEVEGEKLVIAFVNDISERVKISNQLIASEMRFREIVEKLPAGAVIVENGQLAMNKTAEWITGYAKKELTTIDQWFKALFGDKEPYIRQYYETDKKQGFPESRRLNIRRKNGEYRWVDVKGYQFKFGEAWLMNDVTQSVEAERMLKNYAQELELKVEERTRKLSESEAKLKQAIKVAKIGYWEVDLTWDNRITWSDEYLQLFEVEQPDSPPERRYFLQYVHPNDRQSVLDGVKQAILNGNDYLVDYRIFTQKKNEKFLHEAIKCLKNKDGKVVKVFGVVQDVTEEKRAAQQLEQSLRKERELGELKSRFVSMASHEFRTPLSSILSSTGLIEMYNESGELEKQRKHIERIQLSVNNLTTILNDFLSLEKLESGKLRVSPEPVDFTQFAREITNEVQSLTCKGQTIKTAHTGRKVVNIDPHLVKNILLNLLSNAIKYSPQGTNVDLVSELNSGQFVIKITDHGIGIPEEEQKHMFTRFFRATNVSNIKGTGLGLTIVKSYLDLMDGEIQFTSREGEGSSFIVTIPQ